MENHRCTMCGEDYPRTSQYFYKAKDMKDGLFNWCKDCHKRRNRLNLLKKKCRTSKEEQRCLACGVEPKQGKRSFFVTDVGVFCHDHHFVYELCQFNREAVETVLELVG